jgi:hypothetical protein
VLVSVVGVSVGEAEGVVIDWLSAFGVVVDLGALMSVNRPISKTNTRMTITTAIPITSFFFISNLLDFWIEVLDIRFLTLFLKYPSLRAF